MANKIFPALFLTMTLNYCFASDAIFNYYDDLFNRLDSFTVYKSDGFLEPSNDYKYLESSLPITKNALSLQKKYSMYLVNGNYFQKLALARIYRNIDYSQLGDSLAVEIMKSEFQLIRFINHINSKEINEKDKWKEFQDRKYPIHLLNNDHLKILINQFNDSIFKMAECKLIFSNLISARRKNIEPYENQIIKQIQNSKNLEIDSAITLYLINKITFPFYQIKPNICIAISLNLPIDTVLSYVSHRLSMYLQISPYSLIVGLLGNKSNIKQLKKFNNDCHLLKKEYSNLDFTEYYDLMTEADWAIAKLESNKKKKKFLKKYIKMHFIQNNNVDPYGLMTGNDLNLISFLQHKEGYKLIISLSKNHKIYSSDALDAMVREPLSYWIFYYSSEKFKGLENIDFHGKNPTYYEEIILKIYKDSGNRFICRNVINPSYDNFGNKY